MKTKTTPVQLIPIPPHARKLLNQLVDAIKLDNKDLFDPSYNTSYAFNIQLTVTEARCLVDLWDLAHNRHFKKECRKGFMKWDNDGNLIEDVNHEE